MMLKLIMLLLAWSFVCAALGVFGRWLTQKWDLPPVFWWGLLSISMLPFIPLALGVDTQVVYLPQWSEPSVGVSAAIDSVTQLLPSATLPSYTSWWVLVLLLSGSVVRLALSYRRWHKTQQLVATGMPLEQADVDLPCVILSSTHASMGSPFVFGITAPVIVLPEKVRSYSQEQLVALLQHEATHVSYRDNLHLLVWQTLRDICWFNPSLALFQSGLTQAIELRCDRRVVTKLGINPTEYARTMLMSLQHALNQQPEEGHFVAAEFTSKGLSLADYKRRISRIIQPQHARYGWPMGLILLVALSLLAINVLASHFRMSWALNWTSPLDSYRVTSSFGHVAKLRKMRPHGGLDMLAKEGTLVRASAPGKVIIADANTLSPNYGKVVMLQHGNGYQSLYAHLKDISVTPGQWLDSGQQIGTVGQTGRVTGPHLHFEVLLSGSRVNPEPLIKLAAKPKYSVIQPKDRQS